MLLYLRMEFVVVKQGDPAPSLRSWRLKLEAGSEVVFKEGEGWAEVSPVLHQRWPLLTPSALLAGGTRLC